MRKHLRNDESGIALLTVLLVIMLASALMAGMFAAVVSDQRSQGFDRDQSQAYSAAHAGLEKLTTQLAQLFVTDFSPNATQIAAASATPPSISGFNFVAPGGGVGYAVTFNADPCTCPNAGNPLPSVSNDITTGPFAGFKGLITPYTLTVTARSTGGGAEVRLRREVQTVAVPVFQFGIFGEKSLSFHAGANFDFGGRVHTNENLFLASGSGATLTFRDRLTAVGQVVRANLENTNAITASGHTGPVSIPTTVGSTYRNLAAGEGSVVGGPLSAPWTGWKNMSEVTYNTNVRTSLTGAKRLDLPLVSQGARPIDLIRRPVVGSNENVANAPVYGQRYFAQASLRILLSDRAADLTGLPTITATAPIQLDGNWVTTPPAWGYAVAAGARTPIALSPGPSPATTLAAGSTATTLNVTGGVPAWLKVPGGTVTLGGAFGNKVCTGKTATSFTGCPAAPAGGYPLGTTVSVTTSPGVTVSTTVTPAVAAGSTTITVASTAAFSVGSRLIWVNGDYAVTCTGYTAAALNGCTGVPALPGAPANGWSISNHSLSQAQESLLGGFIKIERQNAAGVWTDVTAEILNLGFAAPNQAGAICADPTPNAVIRLQRLRDNGAAACNYGTSLDPTDFWPNNLYDAREGAYRDVATTTAMSMGGVMGYVTIDVGNLKRWLNGTIGATGNQALNNNGYIVYFSDRRGDHNEADPLIPDTETGEYGFEDSINPAAAVWAKSNALELGEDVNGRPEDPLYVPTLETYGETPHPLALPGGALTAPYDAAGRPWTLLTADPQAAVNRVILFRRALKLTNACIGTGVVVGGCNAANGVNNLPDTGLTVAVENPVYVHGNYNAIATDVQALPNRPASILADAITVLSNSWTDANSFRFANDKAGRLASTTGYRFAQVAGKSLAYVKPGWAPAGDQGTDGGVHNFMRMLEEWGGRILNYRGSIVSLYTARQATGVYKYNNNVYGAPSTRAFAFDTDFLQPTLLPPGTPMFRDVNTLRFRQILRPNQ